MISLNFPWVENSNKYEVILDNGKALLLKSTSPTKSEFFEVWFKMLRNSAENEAQILKPRNEDFGVWA